MEAQSVVVIQDASSEICWEAIRWILQGLSLKSGDMVTLLSVLTPVHNPSSRAYMGTRKLVGHISREDSPMLEANHETDEDLIARKMEEYQNSIEHIQITKLYHMQKVLFNIMVLDAGHSTKVVALEAARQLSATWVILDRFGDVDKV